MLRRRHRIALLAAFLVAACGASDEEPATEAEHGQLAEPMLRSIEKAQQVEQETIERKDELDEALRKAEGESGQDP